jgi:hypothetical protein
MSALDSFLLAANSILDDMFGTVTMVCQGQSFQVVPNGFRETSEGATGGIEWDLRASVTAQPSHVSNPQGMLKKTCTVDGREYRVAEVNIGTIAVHFALVDVNQPD